MLIVVALIVSDVVGYTGLLHSNEMLVYSQAPRLLLGPVLACTNTCVITLTPTIYLD